MASCFVTNRDHIMGHKDMARRRIILEVGNLSAFTPFLMREAQGLRVWKLHGLIFITLTPYVLGLLGLGNHDSQSEAELRLDPCSPGCRKLRMKRQEVSHRVSRIAG